MIGHSAEPHKSAALVQRTFASVPYNLRHLELFRTDRGSEFKNQLIDQALERLGLSTKGTLYDNAVAEAMFKTIKNRVRQSGFFN